ncbi:MAG: hypothetical protein ACK5HL_04190 [Bacilli bacterium]
MKVELIKKVYILENGKFNKTKALNFSGKVAGICYSKDGFK